MEIEYYGAWELRAIYHATNKWTGYAIKPAMSDCLGRQINWPDYCPTAERVFYHLRNQIYLEDRNDLE